MGVVHGHALGLVDGRRIAVIEVGVVLPLEGDAPASCS
jgi:hypothetical protein